jgi:two-component system, NarL family, response regulator LiaR
MRKTIFLYGVAMAVLVALLKAVEYRYVVRDISTEMTIGIIAVLFAALGVWAGRKLTRTRVVVSYPDFSVDEKQMDRLGISKREYEVLGLMSEGLSNKEIAEKLFVSLSTVKTHSSNLFAKLDAKRRTQAIQRAKELRLLP